METFRGIVLRGPNEWINTGCISANVMQQIPINDAINVLSKLKSGGILIFDDASWNSVSKGIDKFVNENTDKIIHIGKVRDNEQAIYKKL